MSLELAAGNRLGLNIEKKKIVTMHQPIRKKSFRIVFFFALAEHKQKQCFFIERGSGNTREKKKNLKRTGANILFFWLLFTHLLWIVCERYLFTFIELIEFNSVSCRRLVFAVELNLILINENKLNP